MKRRMNVASKSLANTLSPSAISKLLLFVYGLSLHSGLTLAQAQVPNAGSNVNNGHSADVTVGIIWHNSEPQVINVKTVSSRLLPDRSFGINTFDEAGVMGAMIARGPPGAECMIGTSPYEGGNEFTADVSFKGGPVSASFVACVVADPVIDAEFVELEDATVGSSRASQGNNAENIDIYDLSGDDEFLSWLNEADFDIADGMGDVEVEEPKMDDDDDDVDDDDDWELM